MNFEKEMNQILKAWSDINGLGYFNLTRGYGLDFRIEMGNLMEDEQSIMLECKEKNKPYDASKWGMKPSQEKNMFILDELTVKKMMQHGVNSFLIIRDNTTGQHHLFSLLDLVTSPKRRFNRTVQDGSLKGKWVIDLRHGLSGQPMTLLDSMRAQAIACHEIYAEKACHRMVGEAGTPRTQQLKREDLIRHHG